MIYLVKEPNFFPHFQRALKRKNVPFAILNVEDVEDALSAEGISVFVWNFTHNSPRDIFFGKSIIHLLEKSGVSCFPSYNDCWTYNDKLSQYLQFKHLGLSTPKTSVHFHGDSHSNLNTIPIVGKLRGGAGSSSVTLIRSARAMRRYKKTAFRKGHETYQFWGFVSDAFARFRIDKRGLSFLKFFKRVWEALFKPVSLSRINFREPGYVLLQDFIPNCSCDYRIIIANQNKAWAIRRGVRPSDFRASGSGLITSDPTDFPARLLQLAFDSAQKLQSTFVAFDFLELNDGSFQLIEYSYGLKSTAYDYCPGYWDDDLNFHTDNTHLLESAFYDWIDNK